MNNKQLVKTLEEEVLKIQNQVNRNSKIFLDYSKIEQMEDKILAFNESFFYGPAEKASEYNLSGISYALNGDISSAIAKFEQALQHFNHSAIVANMAKCYEKQSQFVSLNELKDQYQLEELDEYSFTKEAFLNLIYLNVDKKNEDSMYPHLLGYDFVYEKNGENQDSQKSHLVFNVPYVIWKEFYTVFIMSLQREGYEYSLNKIRNDAELFIIEVNNKPYLSETMDNEDISFYNLAEVLISKEDKELILSLYENFIIKYYLKTYNNAYKYEEMINLDPGIDDYRQFQSEKEATYGHLKSAIYNLKNNNTNPFLDLNTEEYQKGISEYRSFFPHIFSNEAIAFGLLESTFEKKLLEKVKTPSLKESLLKEFEGALSAIKHHPSSIYVHVRKSLEITCKSILMQRKEGIPNLGNNVTLNDTIKEVIKLMNKKNYLYQPILDIMGMKQKGYMSKQKFKENVHNIKNDSNKNIHYTMNETSFNQEIDSEKALELFIKNAAILSILIDEFEL